LRIPNTKRAGGVAEGVGPEFKPQYHTQKKISCLALVTHAYTQEAEIRRIVFGSQPGK
jgi:hypothetical protein